MVKIIIKLNQDLWDEIGEKDIERDREILQLEQECLDLYRKKVDGTRKHKAELHQMLADGEAEISSLISTLGERESFMRVGSKITVCLPRCVPISSFMNFDFYFLLVDRKSNRLTEGAVGEDKTIVGGFETQETRKNHGIPRRSVRNHINLL